MDFIQKYAEISLARASHIKQIKHLWKGDLMELAVRLGETASVSALRDISGGFWMTKNWTTPRVSGKSRKLSIDTSGWAPAREAVMISAGLLRFRAGSGTMGVRTS